MLASGGLNQPPSMTAKPAGAFVFTSTPVPPVAKPQPPSTAAAATVQDIGALFYEGYIPPRPAAANTKALPAQALPLAGATVSDVGTLRYALDADGQRRRREPGASLKRKADLEKDFRYWLATRVAGLLNRKTEELLDQGALAHARAEPEAPQAQRINWLPAGYSKQRVFSRLDAADLQNYNDPAVAGNAAELANRLSAGLMSSWLRKEWIEAGNNVPATPVEARSAEFKRRVTNWLTTRKAEGVRELGVLEAKAASKVTDADIERMFALRQEIAELTIILERREPAGAYESLPGFDVLNAIITAQQVPGGQLLQAVDNWDVLFNGARIQGAKQAAREASNLERARLSGMGAHQASESPHDSAWDRLPENTGLVKLAPNLIAAQMLAINEIRRVARCKIVDEWSLVRYGDDRVQTEYVHLIATLMRKKELETPRRSENVAEIRAMVYRNEVEIKLRFKQLGDELGTGKYVFNDGRGGGGSTGATAFSVDAFLGSKKLRAYVPDLEEEWSARGTLRTGEEIEEWDKSREAYMVGVAMARQGGGAGRRY